MWSTNGSVWGVYIRSIIGRMCGFCIGRNIGIVYGVSMGYTTDRMSGVFMGITIDNVWGVYTGSTTDSLCGYYYWQTLRRTCGKYYWRVWGVYICYVLLTCEAPIYEVLVTVWGFYMVSTSDRFWGVCTGSTIDSVKRLYGRYCWHFVMLLYVKYYLQCDVSTREVLLTA